jgi:Zn finger protein HypA/HybF involved in hydrogenase expression
MKIIITEGQLRKINESIKNGKVECSACGWEWKLSEGGKDPFICHKCGHDNEQIDEVEKPEKDETAKWIKCRNCKKLFTQTIHKKKKSLPICPWCGTHN